MRTFFYQAGNVIITILFAAPMILYAYVRTYWPEELRVTFRRLYTRPGCVVAVAVAAGLVLGLSDAFDGWFGRWMAGWLTHRHVGLLAHWFGHIPVHGFAVGLTQVFVLGLVFGLVAIVLGHAGKYSATDPRAIVRSKIVAGFAGGSAVGLTIAFLNGRRVGSHSGWRSRLP